MNNVSQRSVRRVALVIVVLAAFAGAFHYAHKQRLATKPLQDAGSRFHRISLLPRAYAQAHDGSWPPLDRRTRAFALPLNELPKGYTITASFKSDMQDSIPAMLLGNINHAAAYTLTPVDSIATTYIYFGFAVSNEAELLTLADAIRSGAAPDQNIAVGPGKGTLGSATLYRLHNKLGEILEADGVISNAEALSQIPLLMERPQAGFAWVMFLNGAFERRAFPGAFPMTDSVLATVDGARLETQE